MEEKSLPNTVFDDMTKDSQIRMQGLLSLPKVLITKEDGKQANFDLKHLTPSSISKTLSPEADILAGSGSLELAETPSNIGISPKFSAESLKARLSKKKKEIRSKPIDYYDCVLYDLCRNWNTQFMGGLVNYKSIEIHHILRLKMVEQSLCAEDVDILNSELESYINSNPTIFIEYNLMNECIALICALSAKYRIWSIHQFTYRYSDRCLNIKLLDLDELNSGFYTMETIWIASKVEMEPFSSILSNLAKQAAQILLEIFISLCNFISRLNAECSFTSVRSIWGLVAAKNPEIGAGVMPDYSAEVVSYQRLKLKRGVFSYCLKNDDFKLAKELKYRISDFHQAYLMFEQELIGNVLEGLDCIDNSNF